MDDREISESVQFETMFASRTALTWISIFSFFVAIFPCLTLANGQSFVERLRNESNLNAIYNEINKVEWSSENLRIVQALWNEEADEFSDLPWERLRTDIIKLALANVLMQAHRHCRIEANMDELHDFVKSRTMSRNLQVKGRAIYLLGLSGYEEDIPFLVSVVESEREGSAEEAALSLTFVHSNAAIDAVRELEKKVSRPTLKSFLKELVDKYQTYPIVGFFEDCGQ